MVHANMRHIEEEMSPNTHKVAKSESICESSLSSSHRFCLLDLE